MLGFAEVDNLIEGYVAAGRNDLAAELLADCRQLLDPQDVQRFEHIIKSRRQVSDDLTSRDRELIASRAELALRKKTGLLVYGNVDEEKAQQLRDECADLETTLRQMRDDA